LALAQGGVSSPVLGRLGPVEQQVAYYDEAYEEDGEPRPHYLKATWTVGR
jgi:hypothetical protein